MKSQGSTTPKCNGAASPWGNHLLDHGWSLCQVSMLSLSVLEKTFGRWGQHFFWVLHWGCSHVWDWWPKFQAISHSWWHCKSWQAEIFKKMHCCMDVLAFKGWINDWLLQVRHLWSPNCTTTTVTPLCGPTPDWWFSFLSYSWTIPECMHSSLLWSLVGKWADPCGTAMQGQLLTGPEQAPDIPSPFKNQFNIEESISPSYQILSW